MALNEHTPGKLKELSARIGSNPGDTAALMERGKIYYRSEMFGAAANDFRRALEAEPKNTEAREFLLMIDEIQTYRYTDILNP